MARRNYSESEILEIFSDYNSGEYTVDKLIEKWGNTCRRFIQDYMKHELNQFEKDFIEKNNLLANPKNLKQIPKGIAKRRKYFDESDIISISKDLVSGEFNYSELIKKWGRSVDRFLGIRGVLIKSEIKIIKKHHLNFDKSNLKTIKQSFRDTKSRNNFFHTEDFVYNWCKKNNVYTLTKYHHLVEKYNRNDKNSHKFPLLYRGREFPFKFDNWDSWRFRNNMTERYIYSGMSQGELDVLKILWDREIKYFYQKKFTETGNFEYDFYIPKQEPNISCDTIIEYDGRQHEGINPEFWKDTTNNDRIKNDFCEKSGIRLIRISHTECIYDKLDSELKIGQINKTRNLVWSEQIENEKNVIDLEISTSLKIKLLLDMVENGKSTFTDEQIIKLTGATRGHFSQVIRELQKNKKIIRKKNNRAGMSFTEHERMDIKLRYENGETEKEISEFYNCNQETIRNNLKRMNIKIRYTRTNVNKKLKSELYDKLPNEFNRSQAKKIADSLNISHSSLHHFLRIENLFERKSLNNYSKKVPL